MKTRWLLFGVAFGVSTLLAGAGDWPQWRGPGRDNKIVGFTAPAMWPKALTKKWEVKVGDGVASPVLVGGKLYTFTRLDSDEVITCVDADTGKEIWKDKYKAKPVTGPGAGRGEQKYTGPRASPVVADGKVCTLGVAGVISCLDAATGKVAWRKDTDSWPAFFTSFSPIIVDGKCVVQTGKDGKGGSGGKGQLTAYDLATGDEKWSWVGDGSAYSSPVLMTVGGVKQLVTLTDQSVIGVGLDGKLLWKIPFQAKYNSVTPIVDGDTVIYAGQGTGTFAVKIEKTGDTYAIKKLWNKSQGPHQYNTPVLKGGNLYGLSPSRNFYCMDAKTGEVLWTDTAARGECGSVLDAGSVMLALTSDMNLVVFKPDPKDYEEIIKYKVADTPTWAMPVVDGKRIFVKDKDSLILWQIE